MGYFTPAYSSELPHRAVTVYMYLRDKCNSEMRCFPSITTICRELSLSRSTVKRALDDLTANGFIHREPRYRENGGQSSNMIYLLK